MGKWSSYAKKIGIYQIRNTVNGRIYIGSSLDIAARWREHKYDLKKNQHRNNHLQNAYNKYGKDAFVYEVLEILESTDNQFKREQYWIDLKDACNKKKGYNIQTEVSIVPKVTKKVVCLETGEIFESLKEAGEAKSIASDSISCCCNKRKLKQTGGLHWRFYDEYVNMSGEEIEEILNDKWLRIVCLETGEIFKSYHETGIKKGTIQSCCSQTAQGNIVNCFGKHYLYEKDYNKLSKEEIQKSVDYKSEGYKGSGEVICLETKEVYKHAREAMLRTGNSDNGILKCCYGKATICGNFHWLFKKEYDLKTEEEISQILSQKSTDNFCKEVVCLETGETFRSEREAAKRTGVSVHMVNKICKNQGINTSSKSLHFVFKGYYEGLSEEQVQCILLVKPKHLKRVRCEETMKIFSSVTEAAKSVGSSSTNISKCCKNQKYSCKGYHWTYV